MHFSRVLNLKYLSKLSLFFLLGFLKIENIVKIMDLMENLEDKTQK